MPNGLIVNDTGPEQIVRNYLIKEALSFNGQNSEVNNIKNRLCFNFMCNTYKATIIKKASDVPLNNDGNSDSIDTLISEFIRNCENVIEETCCTIANVKRAFNMDSQLSFSLSAKMKILLKKFAGDENISVHSRIVEKLGKTLNENKADESLKFSNTRSLQSNTNIIKSSSKSIILYKKLRNQSSNIPIDMGTDEINHPLELFGDSSDSREEENTRKLRNGKVMKIYEKV